MSEICDALARLESKIIIIIIMQYDWAKDLNRLCPKEGVQMANSLTVLNIRNCKSKQ